MKKILLVLPFLFSCSTFGDCIYSFNLKQFIDKNELKKLIPANSLVILGEFHNSKLIQKSQSSLVSELVKENLQLGNFTLGFEFLDHPNQEEINIVMGKFSTGEINGSELLKELGIEKNTTYLPILKVIKNLNGKLIGVNLPRALKKKVIDEGIDSIDPKWVPDFFEVGGENYFSRFKKAMGGHVGEDKLSAYFLAQSLTDAVIADEMIENTNESLKFLVVGSFHSDYFDGVTERLIKSSLYPIKLFKIVEGKGGWRDYLKAHPDYGEVAEFLVAAGAKESSCYVDSSR